MSQIELNGICKAFKVYQLQIVWTAVFILAGKLLMSVRLKNIIVQGG
ncbi:MAG: hypothetical protein HPY74_17725 [Firmicutes bacterium]|nr:hypothetical protein [Bacillota bacterium]